MNAGRSTGHHLLWWVIPKVLAGMPMPFLHPQRRQAGQGTVAVYQDDLADLVAAGVRAVVSALHLPQDQRIYAAAGLEYLSLPIPDGQPPTPAQAEQFIAFVDQQRVGARPVAVHCLAGLGRTGTLLAAYLIAAGASASAAIGQVRAAQCAAIETSSQVRFLELFARARPRELSARHPGR